MSRINAEDVDTLARTIFGEARGEPFEGKLAVALVVCRRWRNRRSTGSIAAVCRAPWQFSCWNADDPNRARLLATDPGDIRFRDCLRAALEAIDATREIEEALTGFADHYMTRALYDSDKAPYWVKDAEGALKPPCAEIGAHVFFNNIN